MDMRNAEDLKKEFGIDAATLRDGRRHYHLEAEDEELDIFEIFDAIYSDIGWRVKNIEPATVIPIAHDKKWTECYVYDQLLSQFDDVELSNEDLFPKEEVEALAAKLNLPNLRFFFDYGDDWEEGDRRSDLCRLITFYHNGKKVFEAKGSKHTEYLWTPVYLYADSNVLAGMRIYIMNLMWD